MGIYILIFEICIIIFYGVFVRTGNAAVDYSSLEAPLYFCLAFTLYSMKHRMFDWSQLTHFLFILAICFQLNTLFIMFWDAAFRRHFTASTQILTSHVLINIECTLAVLVTAFQFTGRLSLEQIFVLCFVEVFAFALNFSINQFGVYAITGGGTVVIFLFGYLFALPIRKWVCDEDLQTQSDTKERYFTQILRLLGLVAMIILWGSFSSATAAVDQYYLVTSFSRVASTALLTAEAFLQMHLGFMAAIGTTIGLRVLGQKIVLDKLAHTLFLSGIFLSSSAVVIIDPFASLLMGASAPAMVFLLEKILPETLPKNYGIEAIILSALGGIFNSIFTAGRNGRTPILNDAPLRQGGYQFACLLITACLAFLFGLLATLLLRCFSPRQSVYKDNNFWFIDQESLPLYPDDEVLKRLLGQKQEAHLKQESILFNLKESYLTQSNKQHVELGKILKQQVRESSANR